MIFRSKNLRWALIGFACFAGTAAGISAAAAGNRGVSHRAAAQPTPSSIVDDVLAKLGNSRLESATVANGTVSVVADPSGGLATIWYAKLAASAIAHQLGDANLGTPSSANYLTPTGSPLGDAGPDTVRPLIGVAPALPAGCGAAVASSAAAAGARVVAVKTLDVLGGACVLTLAPTGANPVGPQIGALTGEAVTPILADHARAYLVTVVDRNGTVVDTLGWVPGIGGDYGQGMGTSGSQTWASSSSGSSHP